MLVVAVVVKMLMHKVVVVQVHAELEELVVLIQQVMGQQVLLIEVVVEVVLDLVQVKETQQQVAQELLY
tara:strand:+ start:469 stop:675 length:207 start_codon:yes stop_codon:yes gene_type:complete